MVERRSIIFSKLFEGLALSAAAAPAVAAAAAPAIAAAAAAAAAPATGAGATATGVLSPFTEVVPAASGATAEATAEGPTVLAPAEVLGTGASDVLGAEQLVSAGGWG